MEIVDIDFIGLEGIATFIVEACDLDSDLAKEVDEIVYIEDIWNVVNRHDLWSEEYCRDDL